MSDLDSEKSVQPVEDAKPVESPKGKIQSLKDKVSNLPNTVDTAIEEGKANGVIEGIQDILQKLLSASFDSCRLASLKLFMLTAEQRKKLTGMLYLTAVIIAGLLCIDLVFEFKLETIILAGAFLLSAYLADLIVQKAVLKTKKRTTIKTKSKPKTKPKPPTPHNTDDDIL